MDRWSVNLLGILITLFLTAGCTATAPVAAVKDPLAIAVAEPAKTPIQQNPQLLITTAEIKTALSSPAAGNFFLVDSRPTNRFDEGHVPGAISIPKAVLSQNLDKLPKDKTIVFYCGGVFCELSPASAEIALQNGFTDVKVWYEGMPGWVKAGNYSIITTAAVEKLLTQTDMKPFVLIDSRPAVKYQQAFIPGAISLPKTEFDLKKGLLPADKSIPLIFYCGGYKCDLSHTSAELALELGYVNVSVYAAGEPEWKEAGLPLWGNEASRVVVKKAATAARPEAIGSDEFKQLVTAGLVTIVDVRSAEDFATGHIPGALNIYDEDFIFKAKESVAKLPDNGRVVLHCSAGGRAGGAYYAILGESEYVNKDNLQYLDANISISADGHFVID